MTDKQDDLQRLYEEASAMEDGHPAAEIRSAVLTHAAMLVRSRAQTPAIPAVAVQHAANWPNWKSGLVASILLVPLLGVLMLHLTEAPELQEKVAVIPHAEMPVASKPAAGVTPVPDLPAHTEAAVASTSPRKAEPVEKPVAKLAKSVAATPVAPIATAVTPSPAAIIADASPPPLLERPAMQGALGAAASAGNRADRPEATMSRSRESAPMVSKLVATPASSIASARNTPQQNSELLQAARTGDVQRVQALLKDGANLQVRDAQGRTALTLAVIGGHASLVKRLLEVGAESAATDTEGLTALQHAQRLGLLEIAALFQ